MSETWRQPLPHPRRGLRGHFPARGAREPFEEQLKLLKRSAARTRAGFSRRQERRRDPGRLLPSLLLIAA